MATKPTVPAWQSGDAQAANLAWFGVAYEGSGTTLTDLNPSADNLTLSSSAIWTGSGLYSGPGFSFTNSTSLHVDGATTAGFAQTGNITVCITVKLTALTTEMVHICCAGQFVNGSGYFAGWALGFNQPTGKFKWVTGSARSGTDTVDTLLSTTSPVAGTAYRVVATYNSTTGAKSIWVTPVGSAASGSADNTGTYAGGALPYDHAYPCIGCFEFTNSTSKLYSQPTNGILDAPKVYSAVLSQALIAADATDPFTAVRGVGFTLSPNSGNVNGSATVTATGSSTSWVNGTTTFSVSGGTGASISGLSINNGTQVATFTLNYGSAGGTLTISDSLDAATAPFTVINAIPVTNANRYFAPSAFYSDGGGALAANNVKASSTYVETVYDGPYEKTAVTGTTTIGLAVDVSKMVAASISAGNYPIIAWMINNGVVSTHQVASGDTTISLATGLTGGTTYNLEWWVQSATSSNDSYTNPTVSLKASSLILDAGGTMVAPTLLSAINYYFGDSIVCGIYTDSYPLINGRHSWPHYTSRAFGAEYLQGGLSGMGYEVNFGTNNWPVAYNAISNPMPWQYHASGKSRLVAGLFSPVPTNVFIAYGQNGTTTSADVQGLIGLMRTAAGSSAWIFHVVPPGGTNRTAITAGVAAYKAANPTDLKVALIDVGNQPGCGQTATGVATSASFDGLHPDAYAHAAYGASIARAAQAFISAVPSTGGGFFES